MKYVNRGGKSFRDLNKSKKSEEGSTDFRNKEYMCLVRMYNGIEYMISFDV